MYAWFKAYGLSGWKSDRSASVKVEDLTRFAGNGEKGSKSLEGNLFSISEGIFNLAQKDINDVCKVDSR
jgi:hypothetical protein